MRGPVGGFAGAQVPRREHCINYKDSGRGSENGWMRWIQIPPRYILDIECPIGFGRGFGGQNCRIPFTFRGLKGFFSAYPILKVHLAVMHIAFKPQRLGYGWPMIRL